jgi:hypothetical protein
LQILLNVPGGIGLVCLEG